MHVQCRNMRYIDFINAPDYTLTVCTQKASNFKVALSDKRIGKYLIHPCAEFPNGKFVYKIEVLRELLLNK